MGTLLRVGLFGLAVFLMSGSPGWAQPPTGDPYGFDPYWGSPYYGRGRGYEEFEGAYRFRQSFTPLASSGSSSVSAPSTYTSGYYGTTPESLVPRDAALIEMTVPANAEIWFSGEKTKSTGEIRSFVTPSLETGKKLAYQVRVRWLANGKPVEKIERVPVHPGDRLNLRIE